MQTRTIGSLEVSAVALGCHDLGTALDDDRSAEIVHAALDCGICYFDTAESYGHGRSEESLGKALTGHRDEIVLATKYSGLPETARDHVEASLRRLGVDHIDLLTEHYPMPEVPFADTVAALSTLVDEGKIRHFGISNLTYERFVEAVGALGEGARFVSLQHDYNLLNRKRELDVLPECVATGTAFTAYFPFYHGILTGKFARGETLDPTTRLGQDSEKRKAAVLTHAHFDVVEALAAFAKQSGRTVVELALGRLLAQPGVTAVLPGAWSIDQVRENAAVGSLSLSAEEIAEIDRLAPVDPDAPDTPSSRHGN